MKKQTKPQNLTKPTNPTKPKQNKAKQAKIKQTVQNASSKIHSQGTFQDFHFWKFFGLPSDHLQTTCGPSASSKNDLFTRNLICSPPKKVRIKAILKNMYFDFFCLCVFNDRKNYLKKGFLKPPHPKKKNAPTPSSQATFQALHRRSVELHRHDFWGLAVVEKLQDLGAAAAEGHEDLLLGLHLGTLCLVWFVGSCWVLLLVCCFCLLVGLGIGELHLGALGMLLGETPSKLKSPAGWCVVSFFLGGGWRWAGREDEVLLFVGETWLLGSCFCLFFLGIGSVGLVCCLNLPHKLTKLHLGTLCFVCAFFLMGGFTWGMFVVLGSDLHLRMLVGCVCKASWRRMLEARSSPSNSWGAWERIRYLFLGDGTKMARKDVTKNKWSQKTTVAVVVQLRNPMKWLVSKRKTRRLLRSFARPVDRAVDVPHKGVERRNWPRGQWSSEPQTPSE